MSLISVQNFLAPLTNKTHMGTIVLGAILFAFFRLQGGTIAIRTDERPASRAQPAEPEARPAPARAVEAPRPQPAAQREALPEQGSFTIPADEGDLLEDIIGSGSTHARPPAPQPERTARPSRASGDGLADIERSLGIR